jgi:hypothetical protein
MDMPLDAHEALPDAKTSRAFCKLFPNSVARNKKVTPELLVILANRATYVGTYVSNERSQQHLVRGVGLGKNVARRAFSLGKQLGLLQRWQLPGVSKGEFGKLREKLTLPTCGKSGRAGRTVRRVWFGSSPDNLTVKEMAALLFMRAGTGKGSHVYAREVQTRFGWSRPTTADVIAALVKKRLVHKTAGRTAEGRFSDARYVVPQLSAEKLAASAIHVKKPGNGLPGNATAGNLRTSLPPDVLPSEEPLYRTHRGKYPIPASPEIGATASDDELHVEACASSVLLGWVFSDELLSERPEWSVAAETLAAVHKVAPDAELRVCLLAAAGRRIASEILSPAGLHAVRWLAATRCRVASEAGENGVEPADAIESIVDAIWYRIGACPGEWLNSLALIGKRLAGDTFDADDGQPVYRGDSAMRADLLPATRQQGRSPAAIGVGSVAHPVGKDGSRIIKDAVTITGFAELDGQRFASFENPETGTPTWWDVDQFEAIDPVGNELLAKLVAADGAKTLSRKLRRNGAGLAAFLHQQAAQHQVTIDDLLSVMVSLLRRHMIDGKRVESVRSWRFFEDAIADDAHVRQVADLGIRPGDLFGAHKRRASSDA